MKKLKRNSFLMIASVLLALFASFGTTSFDYGNDVYLDDGWHHEQTLSNAHDQSTAAVLSTRRPYQQASVRPQRNGTFHGFHSRGNSHTTEAKFHSANYDSTFASETGSFPQPLSFGVPKDYYIFTLKRILC
ncbi:MAG: hypothetical protein MJY82_06420 [Fibrobacter sp.]|nr:hypothetical protein [Fibrobacter sp.]